MFSYIKMGNTATSARVFFLDIAKCKECDQIFLGASIFAVGQQQPREMRWLKIMPAYGSRPTRPVGEAKRVNAALRLPSQD